jgi:hypothetical protein
LFRINVEIYLQAVGDIIEMSDRLEQEEMEGVDEKEWEEEE